MQRNGYRTGRSCRSRHVHTHNCTTARAWTGMQVCGCTAKSNTLLSQRTHTSILFFPLSARTRTRNAHTWHTAWLHLPMADTRIGSSQIIQKGPLHGSVELGCSTSCSPPGRAGFPKDIPRPLPFGAPPLLPKPRPLPRPG